MNEIKKIQLFKCPKCGLIIEAEGTPEENKIIYCPKCDFKGSFKFSTNKEKKTNKRENNKKFLGRIVDYSTGHPWKTLGIFFVIIFLFVIPASQLTINTSIEGMFGEDLPEDVKSFQEISEIFGEQELVTVAVDCSNSDGIRAKEFLEKLALELEGNDWFKDISYLQNIDFAGDRLILYIPEEDFYFLLDENTSVETANTFYSQYTWALNQPRYFVSENGNIFLLNMIINTTINSAEIREEIFGNLNSVLESVQKSDFQFKNLEIGYTGGLMVMDFEGDTMAINDIFITLGITFILILIILFISFRSISLPALALIPLIFGIIITAGLIYIAFGALNMLAAIFAVLLLGLGIDFSIHILTRFLEEMKEHGDVRGAFRKTSINTVKAVILGTLTTATAFGTLAFSRTQAMHEMGIILAVGLVVTMICVIIILPALVTIRLRRSKLRQKLKKTARFKVLGSIGGFSARFAAVFLILFVIFGAFFAVSSQDIEIESDIHELQPKTVPAYKTLEKVKANFNYTEDYILCIASSYNELIDNVKDFKRISEVMEVESILDFLPANQSGKLQLFKDVKNINAEFENLSWLNVSEMNWSDLPSSVQKNWVHNSDGTVLFLIRIKAKGNIWDNEYRDELVKNLTAINTKISARAIMIPKLIDYITEDVIRVTIFAGIPIFVIVYIGFKRRNPIYALLTMIPIFFGVGGLLALSGYLEISLNMVSIMMIPLVIGIGIDNGIHILHRYNEEGRGSIPKVVQNTGKAIFLTTATTCLAFSSFLFAEHPGLWSLGQVPVLGLILCFIAAIIFLPSLIAIILDRKTMKKM